MQPLALTAPMASPSSQHLVVFKEAWFEGRNQISLEMLPFGAKLTSTSAGSLKLRALTVGDLHLALTSCFIVPEARPYEPSSECLSLYTKVRFLPSAIRTQRVLQYVRHSPLVR